jgi:hypothetical protein
MMLMPSSGTENVLTSTSPTTLCTVTPSIQVRLYDLQQHNTVPVLAMRKVQSAHVHCTAHCLPYLGRFYRRKLGDFPQTFHVWRIFAGQSLGDFPSPVSLVSVAVYNVRLTYFTDSCGSVTFNTDPDPDLGTITDTDSITKLLYICLVL